MFVLFRLIPLPDLDYIINWVSVPNVFYQFPLIKREIFHNNQKYFLFYQALAGVFLITRQSKKNQSSSSDVPGI